MNCKDCKHYNNGYCTLIEVDDPDYPHDNDENVGIEATSWDDSGLDVRLRVSPKFGCVLFVSKTGDIPCT